MRDIESKKIEIEKEEKRKAIIRELISHGGEKGTIVTAGVRNGAFT
jgi:hypothetical protein